MKKTAISVIVIILLTAFLFLLVNWNTTTTEEPLPAARKGVAILMTGAAARIPQEAALLEELDKRGILKDLVFISGVSSGALNAVALNGILSGKMSWQEYKSILYNLKNEDVFELHGKKLPVNSEPARKLYKNVFEDKLGYGSIGDLPYPTSISFTHLNGLGIRKDVYRMSNLKINTETDTSLNLVDIIMASSAFPIVFPPVHIRNVKTIPDEKFVDGGVGDDHVPYHALLEFEKFRGVGVERVYIISRKSDNHPEISEELKGLGLNDDGLFDKLGVSLDGILKNGIIKRLKAFAIEAPELNSRTYVWVPAFEENFLLFNFENMEEQYEVTSRWAKIHDPVPLKDFLLPYQKK